MRVARLLIHVEGETEETFVRELIAPHLVAAGFDKVAPKLLGNARARSRRGGIRSWAAAASDIVQKLREDPGSYASTLVDYYALPSGGPDGWPNRDGTSSLPHADRAVAIEGGMERAVNGVFAATSRPRRFVGGVLLHEFEALLFSDCTAFAEGVGLPGLATAMSDIRARFPSREDIDDSPVTAPSKRMIGLVPTYQKPIMGNIGALHIGLGPMRAHCPHFNRWLTRLEALVR